MATCDWCGVGQVARKSYRFCCHACYANSRKGKHGPGNMLPGSTPSNKARVGDVKVRVRHNRKSKPRAWVKVAEPNSWELRARLIVKNAGITIPKGSVVHHVNGDSLDDRPENLTVCTLAEHMAYHRHEHAAARSDGLRRAWAIRKAAAIDG